MIKLVIFDIDGVVLDSESIYIESVIETQNKHDYKIPLTAVLETLGGKASDGKKVIMKYMGPDFDYDSYRTEMTEIRQKKIDAGIKVKKGFFELADYLKKNNIHMTFATSKDEYLQKPILENTKILHMFEKPTYGSDVEEGKPSPDIYLKALDKFGFNKDEAIIVEDSTNGVKAGINAQIKVLYCHDQAIVSEDVLKNVYASIEDLSKAIEIIETINGV